MAAGLVEVRDRLGDEGTRAAGGIQNVLVQRVGHHLAHHGPGQPVRGVVLAQLAALVGRDDGLVQDGGDVIRRRMPVEPCDSPGEGLEQWQATHLRGPGEEVRFHDTLKTGLAAEVTAVEQVRGIGLRQPVDVAAEGRLHHYADDGGQVGMADEQVIHLSGIICDFSQGSRKQVLPQLPLDLDRIEVGVLAVQGFEGCYVPLICRAIGTEVLGDGESGGLLVPFCGERVIAEPFVQGDPAVRVPLG